MLYWWGEAKKTLMARKPDVQRALAFDESLAMPGSGKLGGGDDNDDDSDDDDDDNSEDDNNVIYEDALKEVSVSDYGIVQALLQIAQRSLEMLKQDCEDLSLRRSRLENSFEPETNSDVASTPGRVGVKFVRYLNREEHFFSATLGERSESAWITSARSSNKLLLAVKQMSGWRFLIPVITPWLLSAFFSWIVQWQRRRRTRII